MFERIVLTASVATFFAVGYFAAGSLAEPAQAGTFATQFDGEIPFIAKSIWIYLSVFPVAVLPLFVVRCPRLFRREAIFPAVVVG